MGRPALNLESICAVLRPPLLSILRIMSGLLLLQHGTGKVLKFPNGVVPANFNLMSMPGYAGIIELVFGVLLVVGLFSRTSAFVASGMTAVAYFMVHAPMGFYPILNKGELAALYCFTFLYLAVAGPGPLSLDALLRRRR